MNRHQNWTRRMESAIDAPEIEKIKRKSNRDRTRDELNHHPKHSKRGEESFCCIHCKQRVSTHREASGVNNRNHCPYCLTSRHVDLNKPGDRRATCLSKMTGRETFCRKCRIGGDFDGEDGVGAGQAV